MKIVGIASRVGVQEYTVGNVYRSPETVADSVRSLLGVPITIDHPEEFVNDENEDELTVGKVVDAYYSEKTGTVVATFDLFPEAVPYLKKGYKELSVGYLADVVPSVGLWTDTKGITGKVNAQLPYQYEQKAIECNHLALCQKARAGSVATIFIDSQITLMEELQTLIVALQAGLERLEDKVQGLDTVKDSVIALTDSVQEIKTEVTQLKVEETPTEETVTDSEPVDINELVNKELEHRLSVAKQIGDSADLTKTADGMMNAFLSDMTGYNCDGMTPEMLSKCFEMFCCMRDGGWMKGSNDSVKEEVKEEVKPEPVTEQEQELVDELKDSLEEAMPSPSARQTFSQKIAAQRNRKA